MLYTNAMDVIRQRKEKRDALIKERKNEIYLTIPRIGEIENRLSATGMLLLSRVADSEMTPEEFVAHIMAENRELNEEKKRLLISTTLPFLEYLVSTLKIQLLQLDQFLLLAYIASIKL